MTPHEGQSRRERRAQRHPVRARQELTAEFSAQRSDSEFGGLISERLSESEALAPGSLSAVSIFSYYWTQIASVRWPPGVLMVKFWNVKPAGQVV